MTGLGFACADDTKLDEKDTTLEGTDDLATERTDPAGWSDVVTGAAADDGLENSRRRSRTCPDVSRSFEWSAA